MAKPSFAYGVSILVAIHGGFALPGDDEVVIVDTDIHLFFIQSGELKCGRQAIISILMQVHPVVQYLISTLFEPLLRVDILPWSEGLGKWTFSVVLLTLWGTAVGECLVEESMKVGEGEERLVVEAVSRHVDE